MLKIYIAAPLLEAPTANLYAAKFRFDGWTVTSRWHADVVANGVTVDPVGAVERAAILHDNLLDLAACDVLVALTSKGTPRATLCEVAFALARGKRVIWYAGAAGQGLNIFSAHRNVTAVVTSDDALLAVLKTINDSEGST